MNIDTLREKKGQLIGTTRLLDFITLGAFGERITVDIDRRCIINEQWRFWRKSTWRYHFDDIARIETETVGSISGHTQYGYIQTTTIGVNLIMMRGATISLCNFNYVHSYSTDFIALLMGQKRDCRNNAMEDIRHLLLYLQKHVGVCIHFPHYISPETFDQIYLDRRQSF